MSMREFGRIGVVGCSPMGSGTDIGEAAGASGPSISKHFPSKTDLRFPS
ncbi:TetR family transcriptional regulator [Streptomyces atratus]